MDAESGESTEADDVICTRKGYALTRKMLPIKLMTI